MALEEIIINKGSSSVRKYLIINDKITGEPVSNIGAAEIDFSIWHAGLSAASSIVMTNGNALGSFIEKSWQVVDPMEMPGTYQIDLPNILFNTGSYSIAYIRPSGQSPFGYYFNITPSLVNVSQISSTGINGLTVEQALRILMSHNFGYNQRNDLGGGITQFVFRDFAATGTARVTYSVNASGDRTSLPTING